MTRMTDPPIRLHLVPSRRFAAWLLGVHGAGLASLAGVDLPPLPLLGLGALIAASAWRTVRRHALLRHRHAVLEIHWSSAAGWRLHRRDGSSVAAQLLGDSYVHPTFVLLVFRVEGRRQTVSLFRDHLDEDGHRRLRARLRWAPPGL